MTNSIVANNTGNNCFAFYAIGGLNNLANDGTCGAGTCARRRGGGQAQAARGFAAAGRHIGRPLLAGLLLLGGATTFLSVNNDYSNVRPVRLRKT